MKKIKPFSVDPKVNPSKTRMDVTLPFPPGSIRELIIVVQKQDGSVDVAGPVTDVERCVQLLRQAIVKVVEWNERENKSLIQPAQFIPPGLTGQE